jgi:hypothetical protein
MPVTRNFTQVAEAVGNLTNNLTLEVPGISVSRVLVGAVMQVRLTYPELKANVGGECRTYPAGTLTLNTADVLLPTTYYVYIPASTGTITVSTTNPESSLGRNNFAWLYLARISSVTGDAFVYFVRRMYTPISNLLNEFGDYASDIPYTWVDGLAPSIDADGNVSIEAGQYRRMKFASALNAQADVDILLDNETTLVTSLEGITTYRNGNTITPGSWHKVLLLLVCSGAADERLIAVRQGEPDAEYSTYTEALLDAEQVAATVAPSTYYAPTFPLAYVILEVGDASAAELIDLRQPGLGAGGGGGGGIGDHSLLLNLTADDHLHYLPRNGVRAMEDDFDVGGFSIISVDEVDGVDVSVHAADESAHHVRYADAEADARIAAARAYGSIYVTAGAAGQAMTANTPATLTAYNTNGVSLNTTPDQANNRITVTNAGNYRLTGTFTFQCTSPNQDVRFFAAVNGVASAVGVQTRTNSTFVFGTSFSGILALGAGAIVTVLATTSSNPTLTVSESHLTVERVG